MKNLRFQSQKAALFSVVMLAGATWCQPKKPTAQETTVKLATPKTDGEMSVESALSNRRSRRSFSGAPSMTAISQLLWAAQGITDKANGHRTAPSAGALRPLEVYLVANNVSGLNAGVYHYDPSAHALDLRGSGERGAALAKAARSQQSVASAPASIVIAGDISRTEVKYGARSPRYVHIEVGAAAQNVYLQAESLGLATVFIGSFDDAEVSKVLDLPASQEPFALMPIGRRAQ